MTQKEYFRRRLLVICSLFFIFFTSFPSMSSAQSTKAIHYVALGDSLAAGQTPYQLEDGQANYEKGYVDYLVDYLQQQNYQVKLNNFGKSGYTTSDILIEISNTSEQREAIKQADVITINAGANDLLKGALDRSAEKVDYEKAKEILTTISQNMQTILTEIKSLNPDVDVYVMGYYNAFPYLDSDHQAYLPILLALSMLNSTLEATTEKLGVTFVPTFDAIEQNVSRYLPNPQDIHPSVEGYKVLANAFWEEIKFDAPFHWEKLNRNKSALTQNVPLNKTWTITLNVKVDETTITDETVYIVDSKFNRIPISLEVQEGGKTVKITPTNLYTVNETYRLYVTDGIQSTTGKNLIKPITMMFTTVQ